VSVKLTVVGPDGAVADDTLIATLGPGQQLARFLHEDRSQFLKFRGSLVFRAQAGGSFVVVALVQNQQTLTVIPVVPAKSPSIPD